MKELQDLVRNKIEILTGDLNAVRSGLSPEQPRQAAEETRLLQGLSALTEIADVIAGERENRAVDALITDTLRATPQREIERLNALLALERKRSNAMSDKLTALRSRGVEV